MSNSNKFSEIKKAETETYRLVEKLFRRPLIIIAILLWIVAVFTVSYYCYESEWSEMEQDHNNFVHLSQLKKTTPGKTVPYHGQKSGPGIEPIVQFQPTSHFQNVKGKTNSKEFQKLKQQLSKLELNKQKLAGTDNSKDSSRNVNSNDPEQNAAAWENFTATEKMPDLHASGESLHESENHQMLPENYNLGEIRSLSSDTLCLDARMIDGSEVTLFDCHGQGGNQHWEINQQGEMRKGNLCMDYFGGPLFLFQCHALGGNQEWTYEGLLLHHPISDYCLTVIEKTKLAMKPCHDDSPEQKWWWRKGYQSSHLMSNNEL